MVLASIFFPGDMSMMIYPLTIGGACILTSIIGTFVKLGKSKNVMGALYKGFVVSALTSYLYYIRHRFFLGLENTAL